METKSCLECGPQPMENFYSHPTAADRLFPRCKECTKRRNTANQVARRQARREQGLPISDEGFASHRLRLAREATYQPRTYSDPSGYLERHQLRREQEAREQHDASSVQPQSEDREVLGFGEQEFDLYRYGALFIRSGKVGRGYQIR